MAHGLAELSNLTIRLDVKRENDGGSVSALASDVSGTLVFFNKPFKDIETITVSVKETQRFFVIYDFVDIPNPTHFSVYVFDASGARASKVVTWAARGII